MRQLILTAAILLIFGNGAFAQVNGNWGSWSSWSICSETCGTGSTSRYRDCDNPAPSGGGTNCSGSGNETLSCLIMNYCIPSYYGNTDLSCGSPDYFGCATGVVSCINMTQRCDGSYDCEDGSDENPYFTNCTESLCAGNGVKGFHSATFTFTWMFLLAVLFVVCRTN